MITGLGAITKLAEATRWNDRGRATRVRAELEAVAAHLAGAVGLGQRDRLTPAPAERARSAVAHRLRAVIRRITAHHRDLGDHLAVRIRTGMFCLYTPARDGHVVWQVSRTA